MIRRGRRKSSKIYETYSIYHQGGGQEPAIYVGGFEHLVARSVQLFRKALAELRLKPKGRMLDFGCGNGAALHTIGPLLPGWSLEGSEIDDKYQAEVERIPGVTKCHVGPVTAEHGRYDLITLVHVLEHIPRPQQCLRDMEAILESDGVLLIVLPAVESNPFDLLVADHCSHFSVRSLSGLLKRTGFGDVHVNDQWMTRQLTAIARRGEPRAEPDQAHGHSPLKLAVDWLLRLRADAAQRAEGRTFGIFGSSINAVWLGGELGDKVDFFVDEDRSRVGGTLLGKPIIAPDTVPEGAFVYVAMPFPWCEEIAGRLSDGRVTYLVPPP